MLSIKPISNTARSRSQAVNRGILSSPRSQAGFIISGILTVILVAVLFAALLLLVFKGKDHLRPVKGNGIPDIRQIECSDFDRLRLSGTVDAVLRQCSVTTVVIHGDENLLPLIECEQQNSTLVIRNKRGLKPQLDLVVEICTPTVSSIVLSGAADLTAIDVVSKQLELCLSGVGDLNFSGHADNLDIKLSGVGDLELAGSASELTAVVSGVGDLDAAALQAEQITIKVSGVGDAVVHPLVRLQATVSGLGDITYYGNPAELAVSVSGAGEITSVNNSIEH